MMKGDTYSYLGKPYTRGGGVLAIGDKVWVHPVPESMAIKKYPAEVVVRIWDGVEEICTVVPHGHASLMREYLFNRLEKINDGQ